MGRRSWGRVGGLNSYLERLTGYLQALMPARDVVIHLATIFLGKKVCGLTDELRLSLL